MSSPTEDGEFSLEKLTKHFNECTATPGDHNYLYVLLLFSCRALPV